MTTSGRIPAGEASSQEHLDWQFDFIRASAERYETGHEYEALRLAVAIRILCYDRGRSHSLLGQLGLKTAWTWLDTSRADRHPVGGSFWGPLVFESVFDDKKQPVDSRWSAPGDAIVPHRSSDVDFDTWWNVGVMFDNQHNVFSRKDLVNFVANEDGGAHVDPALTASYHAISRDWSKGAGGRAVDPHRTVRTPVWEFIRQVTFELQYTAHRADPERFGTPTPIAPLPKGYASAIISYVSARNVLPQG